MGSSFVVAGVTALGAILALNPQTRPSTPQEAAMTATDPDAGPGKAEEVLRRRHTVGVIGGGTIGASWTALFLAKGLEVRIVDPRPDIGDIVRRSIASIAPSLAALGLPTDDLDARLHTTDRLEEALDGVDVVQENGPEDFAFKRQLWPQVEAAVSPSTLLLSSSSGIRASAMAKQMVDPARLVIGHPFNPPHLVPLVEVVPAPDTPPALVDEAMAFYRALGKHPLVLNKEVPGFVANRLQSALFRECVHLVSEGVVGMGDLDAIVTSSIGLRWAVAGPFLTFHLGGGQGGLAYFLEHLGPATEAMWGILGDPRLDEATINRLMEELARAYGDATIEELEQQRDAMQLAVLKALGEGDDAG
jgi:ketoreductase RED1